MAALLVGPGFPVCFACLQLNRHFLFSPADWRQWCTVARKGLMVNSEQPPMLIAVRSFLNFWAFCCLFTNMSPSWVIEKHPHTASLTFLFFSAGVIMMSRCTLPAGCYIRSEDLQVIQSPLDLLLLMRNGLSLATLDPDWAALTPVLSSLQEKSDFKGSIDLMVNLMNQWDKNFSTQHRKRLCRHFWGFHSFTLHKEIFFYR